MVDLVSKIFILIRVVACTVGIINITLAICWTVIRIKSKVDAYVTHDGEFHSLSIPKIIITYAIGLACFLFVIIFR